MARPPPPPDMHTSRSWSAPASLRVGSSGSNRDRCRRSTVGLASPSFLVLQRRRDSPASKASMRSCLVVVTVKVYAQVKALKARPESEAVLIDISLPKSARMQQPSKITSKGDRTQPRSSFPLRHTDSFPDTHSHAENSPIDGNSPKTPHSTAPGKTRKAFLPGLQDHAHGSRTGSGQYALNLSLARKPKEEARQVRRVKGYIRDKQSRSLMACVKQIH